jgi:hypothetical protein
MSKGKISRREFTAASVMTLLVGVSVTISGCGGGGSPSGPSPNPTPNPTPSPTPAAGDKNGSVSANHGHTAIVTGAQITAASAITLDIRGTGDHPHTVSLTAAEVTQIGAGTRVSKTSTVDASHDHIVTFN